MKYWAICLAMGLALPAQAAPLPSDWRTLATPADIDRIDRLDSAWTTALEQARRDGHGAELSARGALFVEKAALADPLPPPGLYACSMTMVGGDLLTYIAYPAFRCRISMDKSRRYLEKLTGSQRQIGHIYGDGPRRGVFLGTLQLGDDRTVKPYGRDAEADQAAVAERVGPKRWRMAFPWGHYSGGLDILELVPIKG